MGVLAIYLRLSKEDYSSISEEKSESNSIRNQRLLLHNYISNQEELRKLQIMEYVDDGYSGKNFDRPEIIRLLEDARKSRIQCIIVKDFSRFGRDYVEVGNYIEKVFPFMGIRFIAVNNRFDSIALKAGEIPDLDFSFQNLIYEYYSVENSIKTKQVLKKRRQEGKYMSVYAPYGYLKDPQDKNRLIIDEEASKHVRDIFTWYLQGKTIADMARILDAKGVLTPAEYMTAKGSSYNWQYKKTQGKWCGAIVGRILRNRIYTGTLVNGKTEAVEIGGKRVRYKSEEEWCVTENTHQPIISKELFEEVQNYKKTTLIYKDNYKNKESYKDKENYKNKDSLKNKENYKNKDTYQNENTYKKEVSNSLLKGYIRCGGCKHKLTKRSRLKVSFYCRYFYELHDKKCIRESVYQDEIEEIVLDIISKQVLLSGNSNNLLGVKSHLEQPQKYNGEVYRDQVEEEIKKIKEDNFRQYELYREGKIEKELYLTAKNNNGRQLKRLEERYIGFNDKDDGLHIKQQNQRYLEVLEQNLFQTLIETIEVYKEKRLVIHMKHKSIWSLTPDKRD